MAKEVAGLIKLQIKGGAANPSPPVGPALGSKGINIMDFCKAFNARTQDRAGKVLPVVITYYTDKSYDFVVKTPPVPVQLMEVGVEDAAVSFVVGESVKVNEGPFSGFSGIIEEVNVEKRKLKVMVKIFGRKSPIELGFMQVEKE